MPDVSYGDRTICYSMQDSTDSKIHYISVSRDEGVVLKGPRLSTPQADRLVLKKARWILDKLEIVRAIDTGPIVTGSRIAYLGKHYYTEVVVNPEVASPQIEFNHSRFRIQVNALNGSQPAIEQALSAFFRIKAQEKLTSRVHHWSTKTGLSYQEVKFRQMSKRWGSCTDTNTIIFNPDVVKLPYTLIDYVIVHELCHTKVKSHSKDFWTELSRHLTDWKELDNRIYQYKL